MPERERNTLHTERFFVSSQVYDHDNVFNALLSQTLRCIVSPGLSAEIKNRCKFLLEFFPRCKAVGVSEKLFQCLVYSRKTERYRQAVELARIILLNYHPDLKGLYKRFTNLAVIKSLFDVNFRESVITKALAYGSFPAQKRLVEKYKALLRAKGIAGEEYKWEILGKDHWNLESPDFPARVKKIPFKNLVYQFAVSVLYQLADRYPVELKRLLSDLCTGPANCLTGVRP